MEIDYIAICSERVAELYPLIVYQRPRLMDLPPGAIIGTWAYSVPGKVRFILDRSLELAPGVLPGDLARAWIRDVYKLPFNRRKSQMIRNYAAPLHTRRGKHGFCSYIDIKGAYLSVLKLGYDLEYQPNAYIASEPRPIPAQIIASKLSYAIAVAMSSSRMSNLDVMGKDGIFQHHPLNIYSNPSLFNLAQDSLNAMGSDVLAQLRDNCVYINTDGYIIKEGFEQQAIDIVARYGFHARIKEQNGVELRGQTEVRGVGSWKIDEVKTRRFTMQAEDYTSPMMPVVDRNWLRSKWANWQKWIN